MTAAMLNYRKSKGTIKRIHVNQHLIKAGDKRPLTIKESHSNTKASEVEILDDNGKVVAKVVYRPENPLACGARVWVETTNEVRIIT